MSDKIKKLTALIVDDEPLARKRILKMLESHEVVGKCIECKNGNEAYKALRAQKPDLVFLDIQMPVMGGIDFVETVGVSNLPPIVFITAYDQHAVKAFEYHAVDYLLKPFSKGRFEQAFNRVLERIGTEKVTDRKKRLNNYLEDSGIESEQYRPKLFIKDAGLIHTVEVSDIDCIQSAGNYITIFSRGKKFLYRKTMKEMEKFLNNKEFIRTHRMYIVNIKMIKNLIPQKSGDHEVVLHNGMTLLLSRRYKNNLSKFF